MIGAVSCWDISSRLRIRLICLALAAAALWPVFPWERIPAFTSQLSPFVAVCSSLAIRTFGAGAAIGVVFGVITIFRRRWFCRYICPLGLLLEGAASVGSNRTSWWTRCPHMGRYAAMLTLAGAAVGYPLFLWMDPLSIFGSSMTAFQSANALSGVLAASGLIILLILTFTSGGIWCARLCPLGATQEMLTSARAFVHCRRIETPAQTPRVAFLARRAFILCAAGLGLGLIARRIGAARGEDAPLRPPGAVAESLFAGVCIRCGNCIRACPSKIIYPDAGDAGLAGLLAPVIRYEKGYCREDCAACTSVCPSGALRSMKLESKRKYIMGEALVDSSLCLVTQGQKDCDACARACPFDAVQITWDEDRYLAYPVVETEKCNGCGACERVCPTGEAKAIQVWKRIDI